MPKSYDGNIENLHLCRSMDAKLVDFGKCLEDETSKLCTWIDDFVKLSHQAKRNEIIGKINKDLIVNTPALHKRKKPVSQLADDMTRCVLFDSVSESDTDVATTSIKNRVKKVGQKELTFDDNIRPLADESVEHITNKMLRISKKLSTKSPIQLMENSDNNSKQGCSMIGSSENNANMQSRQPKRIYDSETEIDEIMEDRQSIRNTKKQLKKKMSAILLKQDSDSDVIIPIEKKRVRQSRRNINKANSNTIKIEDIDNHENIPVRQTRRNTKNNISHAVKIEQIDSDDKIPVRKSIRNTNKENSLTVKSEQITNHETIPVRRGTRRNTKNNDISILEEIKPVRQSRRIRNKSNSPTSFVNRTINNREEHPKEVPALKPTRKSKPKSEGIVNGTRANDLDDKEPPRPMAKAVRRPTSSVAALLVDSTPPVLPARKSKASSASMGNRNTSGSTTIRGGQSTDDEFLSANEASPETGTSVRSKRFTKTMKKKPIQTPPPPQRADTVIPPNINAFITDEGCHVISTPVKRSGSIQYVPSYTPKRVHRMSTGGANNPVAFDAPIYTGLGNKHRVISMGPPSLPPSPDHKRKHSSGNPRSLNYGAVNKITRKSTPKPAVVATSRAPSGSGAGPSGAKRIGSGAGPSRAKRIGSGAGPSGAKRIGFGRNGSGVADPSGSCAIQIISSDDETTTILIPAVRKQPESDVSSDESMVEIRSESPFNKHRSITGFQGLSVKEKVKVMQEALNGDSPKVLIPRSKVRRSTRKSHIIRKSVVKPRGPINKRIEAIIQMKQKIILPRMRATRNNELIEPTPCTPLSRITPIVKKKKVLSSVRIKNKLAMSGSTKPATPKPLSKAELRNNELMKLKQEENDNRIRNLQLKRLQIAEEHKKVREVKAKEVATRREIQSSQMKVKRVLSVRKKNEASSLLESRAAMLQERSRADREVRQKKIEEIESKRRLDDEILRRKKKMDIEIEKCKNEEMRRLKNMKADKDRQKRVEIAMLDARLREMKIKEENLRIATESRNAGQQIIRDLEENRLKKLKEREKYQEKAKMRAAVQEMGTVNTLMTRIKDDSLIEDSTSPPAAAASVSCYPSKSIFKQIKSPNMTETPEKPDKGAQTYDIDNLNENSTDDECNPKNEIPEWADFAKVKEQVRKFKVDIPCIHKMFCPIPTPDINEIFGRKKYKPRTSSACWNSPQHKP